MSTPAAPKEASPLPDTVTGVTSVTVNETKNPEKVKCPVCGESDYPYYISRHKHESSP
jgi:hypothetical protein